MPPNSEGVYLSDSSGRLVEGQTVDLNQGQSHTFTCEVEDTRPAATFAWEPQDVDFDIGDPIEPSAENLLVDSSQTLTISDPNRSHHGTHLRCYTNIDSSESIAPVIRSVQINVIGKCNGVY